MIASAFHPPSPGVRLYGTEEPVEAPRILRAGPITAELEAGNLRYIRHGGVELVRAISFIVRDEDWGTYAPAISDLSIEETDDGFRVSYRASAGDAARRLTFEARIEASASGRLVFGATARAETDFLTNRTGFVVLHPAGVSGLPVTVEHVDGRREETHFPRLIDPVQPMKGLRALTHAPATGLRVRCLMEGDAFEMEDQRNWTDASFKTYVRPLAEPWPYVVAAGETLTQGVTLEIEGSAGAGSTGAAPVSLGVAPTTLAFPGLGLGLDPDDIVATRDALGSLASLSPSYVVCHFDPRRGHDAATLGAAAEVAQRLGAKPWLEAVVVSVDDFEAEVAALGEAVAALGSPFETVLVSPASDLKCTLPGSVWPAAPSAAALYEAARRAFPGARIGGGMFSYFTEFNRKRPPEGALDLVSFTTSAVVHAGDDRSVMETLQALPAIAESASTIAHGLPLAIGPSAIGMRANPYGAAPKPNPHNLRQAMSLADPRQRGLLGAAFALGYIACFAEAGAEAIAMGSATGPFGVVHAPAGAPQPFFDAAGGYYPVFHVLRGLCRGRGSPLLRIETESPALAAVGFAIEDGHEVWAANLTPDGLDIALPPSTTGFSVLDAEGFVRAAAEADLLDRLALPGDAAGLALGGFGIVRMRVRAGQAG